MGPDLSIYQRSGPTALDYARQYADLQSAQDARVMRQMQIAQLVKAQQDEQNDRQLFGQIAQKDPSAVTLQDLAGFSDAGRTRMLAAIQQASAFQKSNAFNGAIKDAFATPEARAVSQYGGPTVQAANALDRGQVQGGFDSDTFRRNALSRGADPMQVEQYLQAIKKEGPKVKEYQTLLGDNGRPVTVALFEDGTSKQIQGFNPRPDVLYQDTGGAIVAIDKNTQKVVATLPKSMTPDGAARLNFDKEKFKWDKDSGKWTYDSSRGVRVNTATGMFTPVVGQDGVPLEANGGKPTEDQSKAAGWLVQASNAYKNMMGAINPETGTPSAAKPGFPDLIAGIPSFGATEGIANVLRSTDRQKFMQASSSLSEALLRAATGAGVNKSEAEQKIRELTPVFGESAETTKQKMASIPLYIKSLEVRAGPAAKLVSPIINAPTVSGGPTTPSRKVTLPNGVTVERVE